MSDRPEPTADDVRPPADPATGIPIDAPAVGCTPSLEDLYRYMDGQLDGARRAVVHSHLDACGSCGEVYDLQSQFRRLIELRCQSELPADLKDRVFGAITELALGPDGTGDRPRRPGDQGRT